MRVVVDQNIPFGEDAFQAGGDVVRLPGREIRPADLKDASILIVRSVTRVDASLLRGSQVRFVGTCTIGTDHLDTTWLESEGISWASAAGCNARSVAEYVVAALAFAHLERRIDLSRAPRVGIVGAGRVGSAVADAVATLGLPTRLNDPPRAQREGPQGFTELHELVESCDIVCGHLPLVRDGAYPTAGILDADLLLGMPRNGLFLNAGRGATSPSDSLRRILASRPDLNLVLDVWDPEPAFPSDIAQAVLLSTPHIAGYSLEGKVEGTRLVRQRLGALEGWPSWDPPETSGAPLLLPPSIQPDSDSWDCLCRMILAAYDIGNDSERMWKLVGLPDSERMSGFDRMRKDYPVRREFRIRSVREWERLPEHAAEIARRLGFKPD